MQAPQRPPQPQTDDKPAVGDRIRYYVDLFLSWSPAARFLGLFGVSFSLVALCAFLVRLVGPKGEDAPDTFGEAMWWAMMRVLDTGAMGEDKQGLLRLIAVLATLSGVMVVALLIGLVSSTVADKLEDLRRGKSPVIDEGHTLILGYSEKIFPILRELREANMSRRRATIVILSSHDKIEVEDGVRERMGGMGTTRVVVRQGSPFSVHDLRKVGAGRARSIIVLASDVGDDAEAAATGSSDPDMNAIKTLLALRRVPGALTRNHAVVELVDGARTSVVERLGQGGVEVVAMRETLARLMVQTSRQSGLAGVYRDLLSFDGSELYIKGFPQLAGMRFADVCRALRRAVPIGLRRPKAQGPADILVNPPGDTELLATDELLVLAEDDDAFSVDRQSPLPAPEIRATGLPARPRRAERIFVAGYRSDLERIVVDFDAYVPAGTEIHVMPGPTHRAALDAITTSFQNLTLVPLDGDPASPAAVREVTEMGYDSVLHLANDDVPPAEADATTVLSLLMMRDAFEKAPRAKRPRMISEIIDPRTKDLVTTDDVTDFVVSSEITSMLLAQVSEQRELNRVFADLFDPEGSEIYLKSVERYAPLGQPVAWLSVQRSAQRHGEVAIGCFRPGLPPVLNPDQAQPLTFRAGDKLVVVAENDEEAAVARAA